MLLRDSSPNSRHGIAVPGILLIVLATLTVLAGERLSFLESSYYDFLQRQNPISGSDRILLIDTEPLSADGELWDASMFSPIIDALNTAGAALIVPVQTPPASAPLPDMKQLTALAELEKRARQAGNNTIDETNASLADQLAGFRQQYERQAAIASTVKDAGNIVLSMRNQGLPHNSDATQDDCLQHAVPSTAGSNQIWPWVDKTTGSLTLPGALCKGAVNAGYGDFWPDTDGVVRRAHLLVKSGSRIVPSLPLAVAQSDQAQGHLDVDGAHHISIDDRGIKTGPGFTSLIRFYQAVAGQSEFFTISAADLLSGDTPSDLVRDRIVLIGDLEAGPPAKYRTPFNDSMPATVLLATAVSNLLQMDFVARPYWLGPAEIAILVLLGIAIMLSAPTMSINRAAILTILMVAVLLATEAYLLIAHGIWVQLVTATLFVALSFCLVQMMSSRNSAPNASATTTDPSASPVYMQKEDQLDLAFSVLRQQAPTEETKKRLYGIAMTHGKLKEFAKAERVLLYLASIDPDYRDVDEKLKALSGARRKNPATAPAGQTETISVKASDSTGEIRELGRYHLDRIIGRGAMATVYLATDPKINRKVAIKTIALAEEFSDEDLEAAKAQFLREAESAGRLNHPNIIAIYDTGEDGNVAYLAMEYFDAKTLGYYAQSANLLPPKWVLELTARAAEALHYAHGQNVVHRDIKPANLLYDAETDTMKITDFGIARLTDTSRTKTGIILGTPSYMSPEQLAASAVTGKSDLYSLGITMYQLLTGTTPFRSDSIPKLMDKILNDKHKSVSSHRDDVPVCVDVVIDKVLAKYPEDRFSSGRAMALALRECCSSFAG